MSNSTNENYTYSEYYKLYEEQKAKYEELSDKLKPKLEALSDKIEEIKEEMKPTKLKIGEYDALIHECRFNISVAQRSFNESVFSHLNEKLKNERLGKIAVVQIDDDEVIAELEEKKNIVINSEKDKIKVLEKKKESCQRELEKFKEKMKPYNNELNELKEKLNKERELRDEYEQKYQEQLAARVYSSLYTSSNSSSYSPYSSYSSSSFYGQDNYAKVQADALRVQADEARKQTEIAQQQLREMQKQKIKAEEEERKRRAAEFHQKQLQDLAIDSRCRSCSVISCGMRFNKSNVNCAGYKPK